MQPLRSNLSATIFSSFSISICLLQIFSYEDIVEVTSLSPAFVPSTGGTRLSLAGSGFSRRGDMQCRFGEAGELMIPATSYAYASESGEVLCIVSSLGVEIREARSVQVFVATINGQFHPTGQWVTYVPPMVVSSIEPMSIDGTGKHGISIIGYNFPDLPGLACRFGGREITLALWVRSTLLRCLTPVIPPGEVVVEVTFNGVDFVAAPHMLGVREKLMIIGISPSCGPISGGTEIVLTGTGFDSTFFDENKTAEVGCSFGSIVVPAMVHSPVRLSCDTPAGFGNADLDANGFVPVAVVRHTVSSPYVRNTVARSMPLPFLYLREASLLDLDPMNGPAAGGTRVELPTIMTEIDFMLGLGLDPVMRCKFGSVDSAVVVEPDPSAQSQHYEKVLCITPPLSRENSTSVAVQLSLNGGQDFITSRANYTYFKTPEVTAVEPPFVPAKGGSVVTLRGHDFPALVGSMKCIFDRDTLTMDAIRVSSSSLECVAPPHPPGMVLVSATFNGVDISESTAILEYTEELHIESISPKYAVANRKATVTLGGTGLVNSSLLSMRWRVSSEGRANMYSWHLTKLGFVNVHEATFKAPGIVLDGEDFTFLDLEVSNNALDFVPVSAGLRFAIARAPQVSEMFPRYGTSNGGATLSLVGRSFLRSVTWCRFGLRGLGEATDVPRVHTPLLVKANVENSTHLTCVTPAAIPGAYFVEVLAGVTDEEISAVVGASVPPDHFATAGFSVISTPVLTGVTPNVLPESGGVLVTIEGDSFMHTGLEACRFGGAVITSATWWDESAIQCHSPPGTPGMISLEIMLDGVTWIPVPLEVRYEPDRFIYSLSPYSGPEGGGTAVRVLGVGFSASDAEQMTAVLICNFGRVEVRNLELILIRQHCSLAKRESR